MTARTAVRMDRREELTLMAGADLEAAAFAYAAAATVRQLYLAQPEGGPVDQRGYDHVAGWLADDYDRAVHAFKRADETLRREVAKRGKPPELAGPFELLSVLVAARALRLDAPALRRFVAEVAGAYSLATIDQHGLAWLVQFFKHMGYTAEDMPPTRDRGRVASDDQLTILRAMFEAVEGTKDSEDRLLLGWLDGRYGITSVQSLDAEACWKAIVRLRERLASKHLATV